MFDVTVIWPKGRTGRFGPTFRDSRGYLIEPLTDFVQSKASVAYAQKGNSTAYRSEMDSLVSAMRSFAEFVSIRGLDWQCVQSSLLCPTSAKSKLSVQRTDMRHWLDVTDEFLAEYRDWEFARVRVSSQSRGDEEKNQKTTNRKLMQVYGLYVWAQDSAAFAENLVGWQIGYNIRSALSTSGGRPVEPKFIENYPLCSRTTSTMASAAYEQHWATKDEMRDLALYFDEHSHPLIAERDILLLKLGQHVAWRASSVSSLTVDLFSDKAIALQSAQKRSDFLVTPPVQKNGHKFAFRVPWNLALQINAYIHDGVSDIPGGTVEAALRPLGGRAKLVLQSGHSKLNAKRHIFLSSKDATPLSAHAIVKRFASAIKFVGAPKGSGYHSLRRARADEFGDETMEKRRRLGLSTAREDVELDFIELLGHANGNAYQAYVRASRRILKQTTEERQRDELVASSMENLQLMARLAYQDEFLTQTESIQTVVRKRATSLRSQLKK